MSNNWYDKFTNSSVYCVSDDAYSGVGTNENSGKMSPRRMLSNTLADQLKLHTNGRSKSIGISIKDRGAILPAGHAADAAYWLPDDSQGKFVSSTYYFEKLPEWVNTFNNSTQKEAYLTTWETLYPIGTYSQSDIDNSPYEGVFEGKETPTFPYDLKKLAPKNNGFGIVKYSPFGNSYLTDFALEAILQEQLGNHGTTDFLSISYSSPDYIGHKFGANAIETEDTYLRLDLEIQRLLNFLDDNLGKNNYTFVLTADHGAVHVPAYLQDLKIPGGYIDTKAMHESIETFVKNTFGSKALIKNISNYQVFFDDSLAQEKKIALADLENQTAHFIQQMELVDKVYTRSQFKNGLMPKGVG
ncbi:MAG: alkaline phosphatase family protein, partial [Flavobacteriaceae bacterium]|nr:alkaline phosphatase family protein [Flavobacteriaceae bacterium]